MGPTRHPWAQRDVSRARQYSVNGERRHYVLLRAADETTTTEHVRQLILRAYAEHEQQSGTASA